MRRTGRALTYSLVGFGAEVIFSAVHDLARGRRVRLRTSPWMFPIYACIQPLYEPLHERLCDKPVSVRAAAYASGFFAMEYATGQAIRRATGKAPWDYSDDRWNLQGLIKPTYAPLWATAGLLLEGLHDRLTGGGA